MQDKTLPIVRLRLVFRAAGVAMEESKGRAKMLAMLLGEGTRSLGSAEFNKALETRAIELDFSCGFETFVAEINCLKEHLEFALKSLADVLAEPNFTKETLEKLKTKTQGLIAAKKSDFDYLAKRELNSLLYAGSNLAYASIGDEKSVEKASLEELEDFKNRFLDLSNLFIVLGGDVEASEIDFSALLASLPVGAARELPSVSVSNLKQTSFTKRESDQAYVYFGAPYNVAKEDRWLANVATFVLGSSGFGSRLMEEIRVKRGLAYGAYARNVLELSHTALCGYLQTKNESKDEAIKIVREEFAKFVKNGVSPDELKGARDFLLGSEPLSKETLFKRLDIAQSEFYAGFKEGEFERNLEKIKNLELKRLNDFIAAHSEICDLTFATIYGGEQEGK